jgi:hypothetical protein
MFFIWCVCQTAIDGESTQVVQINQLVTVHAPLDLAFNDLASRNLTHERHNANRVSLVAARKVTQMLMLSSELDITMPLRSIKASRGL